MRFEAPHRSLALGPSALALIALAGCGNRGELYLAPSVDAGAELRALERLDPADGSTLLPDAPPADAAPATEPLPGVSGEGVAPTVAPELDPELDPGDEDESGDDESGESGS